MFHIQGDALEEVVRAIDDETAVKVVPACFRDGLEEMFEIDFFQIAGKIVRYEYNRRSTETYVEEVTGDDLDLFKTIYHLH